MDGYCAVLSTGGVDCWGDNSDGELGNGTFGGPDGENGYDTPQAVVGISNAASVTSDDFSYCALLSTGGLDCWGADWLGNGSDTAEPVTGITKAVSVANDGFYGGGYCAVLAAGGVDCWGNNDYGELGNRTIGGPDGAEPPYILGGYDTPQAVTGITNAVSVASEDGEDANAPGYCAVLSTGGLDCWGDGSLGELGNGTTGGPERDGYVYDTPQAVSSL